MTTTSPLIAPEVAGTSGPPPQFRRFDHFNDEAHYIARCIGKWHKQGKPLNNIAVVYAYHWQAGPIQKSLKAAGIACAWLNSKNEKKNYDANADSVTLLTLLTLLTRQSSKGLEFGTVVLAGVGGLRDDEENLDQEVRLLYVGMTRARERLLLTGSGGNWFTGKLDTVIEEGVEARGKA